MSDQSQINALQADMNAMKALMQDMVKVLTKIALLEERQQTVANVTQKILERIERMEVANHDSEIANARFFGIAQELRDLKVDYEAMKVERAGTLATFNLMKWALGGAWTMIAGACITWSFNHFMSLASAVSVVGH